MDRSSRIGTRRNRRNIGRPDLSANKCQDIAPVRTVKTPLRSESGFAA